MTRAGGQVVGRLRRPAPAPSNAEVAVLLAAMRRRARPPLVRLGLEPVDAVPGKRIGSRTSPPFGQRLFK